MRAILITTLSLLGSLSMKAQITQAIRGEVVDKITRLSVPGAHVLLMKDTSEVQTSVTDFNGNYNFNEVPIGKYTLFCSAIGYKDLGQTVVLTSAKEVISDIHLEEDAFSMGEVEIRGVENGEVLNKMALVSAKQFSVEETQRYAGSRGDPARMASNFAGVQGADDSRNDIVVRGNSPLGVVWRVEGVDIPNPNHFAISGSSGGPVSIINNKIMGNSDFFTGAFPAEYGNSISSVFNIRLRNGNNLNHEFSGQLGFLGTELMAEGPIHKKSKSSYLAMYRYSTVGLFSSLGIDIGTEAIPKYQDASFKLNFPTSKGSLSLWALGGSSSIDIKISEQIEPDIDLFGENDRDQYFRTSMAIAGLTWSQSIGDKSFLKATLATSAEKQNTHHDFIVRHITPEGIYEVDSLYPILKYTFLTQKNSLSLNFNHKLNSKTSLKFGINSDLISPNLQDSVFNDSDWIWVDRYQYKGSSLLIQPYLQSSHQFSEKLTGYLGFHASYFSLNNSASVFEPRASLKWKLTKFQSLSAGFGIHSQMQPLYTYFYHKYTDENGEVIRHNEGMDFTKSAHYILGYDNYLSSNFHFKIETYYQSLSNIPTELEPSSFSMVNAGSGFARFFPDSLSNSGTGRNLGVELTLEKFFNNSFFFLATGSIYDSKYKGSDGIERNTDYNGNFALNLLAGKEFQLNERVVLSLGSKITWAGGKRYGIVDEEASNQERFVIFQDSLYNEFQFRDYFRFDTKVNLTMNRKKTNHEIAIDFVNMLSTQNILSLTYAPVPGDPDATPFVENYQLGFLPIFYYKVDF